MSCAESACRPAGARKDIMQAFTIDADNNITIFASSKEVEGNGADTETFRTPQELAALAAKWPVARLVEIWNSLPGVEPVQRFTSICSEITTGVELPDRRADTSEIFKYQIQDLNLDDFVAKASQR